MKFVEVWKLNKMNSHECLSVALTTKTWVMFLVGNFCSGSSSPGILRSYPGRPLFMGQVGL